MPVEVHDEMTEADWQFAKQEAIRVGLVLLAVVVLTVGAALWQVF